MSEATRIKPEELDSFGESDEEGVRLTPAEWQRVRATVEWVSALAAYVSAHQVCSYCDAIHTNEAMPAHVAACPAHPTAKAVAAERERRNDEVDYLWHLLSRALARIQGAKEPGIQNDIMEAVRARGAR